MIIEIGDRELNELRMHRAHARLYGTTIRRAVNGIDMAISPYATDLMLMRQYRSKMAEREAMGRRLAQIT